MGKSLRSKSKLKFRTIKRATGVFGKADKDRAQRLAAKLGTLAKKQLKENNNDDDVKQDGEDVSMEQVDAAADENSMEDDSSKPKVSTSGWKGSRNDAYKKRKASKNMRTTIKFSRKKK
ncbi:similar to Saccharomyces cerevisiae YBL028C Protein of unknown function that may interact with ribosomes [Geotrichum candidum]|uniref:DUF2423 domain-containing protein n=1 Tax=Geotrichum candidum TaxID=1173061 RepID=A0A0J9X6Y9_GEOCN|nr:similar to Saccharomyces cerevisiae YBL028C Protein of unknown function that may interact with ribosomes [Geotrichum candidum]